MKLELKSAVVGLAIMSTSPWLLPQGESPPTAPCNAPSYFGMCDPFVPGTIIFLLPEGRIKVNSTWPGGPADQAGVCPGDQIISADGVPGSDGNFDAFLKAIVSDQPTPVDLKIKRGDQNLDFQVPRVRESTLAQLSEQKYARLPLFPDMEVLVTVPLDESSEELQVFRDFELRLGRQYGFKLAEGYWMPEGTPQDQAATVAPMLRSSFDRLVARLHPEDARGPDCSFLLLKNPDQVLVGLVEPGSTTSQAGLFPGDELVALDGHPVAGLDQKQLSSLIFKTENRPHPVSLRVRRGASEVLVTIESENRKDLGYGSNVFGGRFKPPKPSPYMLGLRVVESDGPRQVMVVSVTYPSPAFRAGLLLGDFLSAVNGEPIEQLPRDRLSELLNPSSPSEVTLDVSRLGRHLRLRLTPATLAQAQSEIGRKMTANGPASGQCAAR
jgi:C-terminal processing protease CtpA/Prc